jgi:hypothetical protein
MLTPYSRHSLPTLPPFPNVTNVLNSTGSPAAIIPGGSVILRGLYVNTIRILIPNHASSEETSPMYPISPGLQYISYYVSGGNAIVFGDINSGPEAKLISYQVDSVGNLLRKRAHSIFGDNSSSEIMQTGPGGLPWPNANVVYKYETQQTRDDSHDIFLLAISNFQSILPFIQFTEVASSPGPSELGILNIRKGTVTDSDGNKIDVCNSYVGYSPAIHGIPMDLTLDSGCDLHSIAHQIGHVLGLIHEYQRPDRDEHVQFVCSNLEGYAQFPDPVGSPCEQSPWPLFEDRF